MQREMDPNASPTCVSSLWWKPRGLPTAVNARNSFLEVRVVSRIQQLLVLAGGAGFKGLDHEGLP